ncbi:MAG: Trm112 family protein [Mycobacterium sp.]
MIDEALLAILVCPADRGPLLLVKRSGASGDSVLYNPRLHRAYRIEDGIPVLLVDEATAVDDDEHARLTAQAGPADPR